MQNSDNFIGSTMNGNVPEWQEMVLHPPANMIPPVEMTIGSERFLSHLLDPREMPDVNLLLDPVDDEHSMPMDEHMRKSISPTPSVVSPRNL